MTSELIALRPDVVLLQESIEPATGSSPVNQTQHIAAALKMQAVSSCGRLDDERRQCIAVLSRFPIQESKELSTAADRAYALAATIDRSGQSATIVCVHLTGTWKLDLQHANETTARREQECQALADWAGRQQQATIIAGDFNPVSAQSIGKLAEAMLPVEGLGATFPSNQPTISLDRAFASPHWTVKSAEAVDSQVSDHRPIVMEFACGGSK
ncbi:MAG: endonuclease/exonuclease/phosphatase family protein [Planctomycetes bacterium]|nr:endonuclease/exonuclease/phosphatase family protein [Planctomycetota bacterium]